jgi:AcrR family transcriptional regulator
MLGYCRGMDDKPYHHGDLRTALLAAAEAEIAERGIEAFSLRQVARRAGVSHAAPAHHFGDANGLLTALAAEGFRQFLATQEAVEATVPQTPRAQLIASGVGYVSFARARPALFRLMFGSQRTSYADAVLKAAADAALGHLMLRVKLAGGQGAQDIAAVWATAHGLADLMVSGRMKVIENLPDDALQDMIVGILARSLPM